jgi:nitroreductase
MVNVFHRRSIRKYQDRPVEREKIIDILRAGMAAPSAHNQRPWRFYVAMNREKIKALSEVSKYSLFAAKAPVIIVTVFRNDCLLPKEAPIDVSACMENMWIETDALGLGGVWMGIFPRPERMETVTAILDLPENETPFAMFALGYAAEEKRPHQSYHEDLVTFLE